MKEEFVMIQKYLDGELEKEYDIKLFTILSQDESARNYFKQMSILKNVVNQTKEGLPFELEEKTFNKIMKNEKLRINNKTKIYQYFAYAAAIIFLFLTVYFFNKVDNVKSELEQVNRKIKNQNETIQLLYNSIPYAEVKASYPYEVIIKSN